MAKGKGGGGTMVARATNALTANRPRMVRARERELRAIEMRMAGLTFEAIAAELGISREAVRKAVNRSLEQTEADISELASQLRGLEAQRLEKVSEVLWPQVQAGNLRAIDRYLRTRESYRKLLNLDLRHEESGQAGATYIVQAGGDISLVPPGGVAIDTRPPWSRPELQAGDVIDAEAVEGGEG